MPKLKHNRTIRVKSIAGHPVRPAKASIVSNLKHRLKPTPVKSIVAKPPQPGKVISPNPRKIKATSRRTTSLATKRTIRQLPNTRARIGGKRQPVNRRSATSNGEAIKILRNIGVNRILIIVGNGPSHKEAALDELLKYSYIDFMSVNRPDDRIWPTKHWIFCDNSQQRRHKPLWASYNGTLINSSAIKQIKPNSTLIKSLHGKGFSQNLIKGMYIGRSSVYAAIQVGVWMNYDHIYVFGCDMTAVGGKLYPWGTNPDVPDQSREKRFKHEAEHYAWMANNIPKPVRNTITFCTRYNTWPFIKSFEQLDHIAAISKISDRHTDLST